MRIQSLTMVDATGTELEFEVFELVELINTDSVPVGLKLMGSAMACPMCCNCEITDDYGVAVVYKKDNIAVYSQLIDGFKIPDHLRENDMKAVDIVVTDKITSSANSPIVHEKGCLQCNMG